MSRFYRRRKYCRFTAEGVKEIDYKDHYPEPKHGHQSQVPATAGDCGQACAVPRVTALH